MYCFSRDSNIQVDVFMHRNQATQTQLLDI